MATKIYTKTGDKGKTALIGGTKVPKSHLRIETYGTVDELNSYIGLVNDHITDAATNTLLKEIQDRLFTIGASLATDPEKETGMSIPDLKAEDVQLLEKSMDAMNEELPVMKSFILPGGHVAVSTCMWPAVYAAVQSAYAWVCKRKDCLLSPWYCSIPTA